MELGRRRVKNGTEEIIFITIAMLVYLFFFFFSIPFKKQSTKNTLLNFIVP